MLSMLARRRPAVPPRRALLTLEWLSPRHVPSGTTPVIKDFVAEELANGIFRLTGRVEDDQPAGLTVTLGGGMDGVSGETTTTAADGTFSITVFVGTSQSGMATATVRDDDLNVSGWVGVDIEPTHPPHDPQPTLPGGR